MNTINLAEAKAKLSELLTDAEYKGGRTVIARRNKPAAVVIGYDDFKKFELLEDIYESRMLETNADQVSVTASDPEAAGLQGTPEFQLSET